MAFYFYALYSFHKQNTMKLLHSIAALLLLTATSTYVNAQVFSNKEAGKKNEELRDSLKTAEYPYVLPIWGEKASKKGFNLPYSAGISAQYFWQQSDLILENLEVGFNNGTMYNLDGIIQFDKAKATADATTIRPDVWLFPFLNVYGILGKARASTDIGFGVYVPDSNGNRVNVFNSGTKIDFNTTTFGLGMTPTIGVMGCFLALDMNIAWTDVPQLNKPARSFVFGPRLGKSFNINRQKERAFAVWCGAFRVSIKSATSGSIPLSDALGSGEFQTKIDNAEAKINDTQQGIDTWWGKLTPVEQKNPVNVAKYNAANSALEKAGNVVAGFDQAASTLSSSTVQYSMDKRPADKWNFIVGGQFQINKHFMLRGEYGFLASRQQFLIGTQFRFGL
jgi:hypothetical protein